ncbi:MAG: hypothetical protein HGA77_09595 [Chlorobiaceae bacterium]|nr:hypothetical protein [Chlorobiaceae bacterium]
MKRYSFPLLFLFSFFMLVACADNPRSTAQKFTENLADGKITEAKKYATEPTGKMLDFAASLGTLTLNRDFRFTFVSETVKDNTAQVVYREKPEAEEQTLDMVKVDGKWKVDMQTRK